MNYPKIQQLKDKLCFSGADVARALDIAPASAWVTCSRYVRKGIFLRLKKDFYVLDQRWLALTQQDFFKISNLLQVPSYVSLMTALSFYGVTDQVQKNFFENISWKRSVSFKGEGADFYFYKMKRELYFDFVRQNDVFIATKEKALVDALYLYSFGKYAVDLSSLDVGKLDKGKIQRILKVFPLKTRRIAGEICGI